MKEHMKFVGLLTISVFLYTPTGFAQDKEESASKDSNVPASQEVEINEDNYRQFMELRDARQQRNILPEDAFKPNAGLQKLDKLPEESQKHLRNQLREIIVQGDEWQPGDEGKHYPYVPSEAASTNPELQKQEAEAWGELVDSYHRREAEIYENSARSQAAMASDGASNGGSNTPNGSPGDGTGQAGTGEAGAGGEAANESRPEQSSTADSYSPNTSNDPNARNTAGVSQNAMEFLKGQGLAKQGSNGQGNSTSAAGGNGEQSADGSGENTSSPVGDSAQGDALEQSEQQADSGQSTSVSNATATASNDAEAKSMDGSSQNALEFLQKNGDEGNNEAAGSPDSSLADNGESDEQGDAQEPSQSAQQDSDEQPADSNAPPALTSLESGSEPEGESTSGVSQNALEFLVGESGQPAQGQAAPSNTSAPEGSLSIKDLMNAKGVGNANTPAPPPTKPKEEPEPVEPPPDKDGGGQ